MDPYDRLISKKSAIFFLTLFLPRLAYAILLDIGTPYKEGTKIEKKNPNGYRIEVDESFSDFYRPRILACLGIVGAIALISALFVYLPIVLVILFCISVGIDLLLIGCRALYVHDKLKTVDKSVPVRLEDLWSDQFVKPKDPSKAEELRQNMKQTGSFGEEVSNYY